MEKTLSLYVMGEKPGRLDTYITEKARISRTLAQKLIEEGFVTYNNNIAPKSGTRLKEGDLIFVRIPVERRKETRVKKEDIPIDVIYEDDNIIVVNKARGMVVHPAAGHQDGTLVNALLYYSEEIEQAPETADRPGIVHRLDKGTSGIIIAAKDYKTHQKLVEMFRLRQVKKEYIAVVYGRLKNREGIINLPIGRHPKDRKKMAVVAGGKSAVTKWKIKKAYKDYTVLLVYPETGRTHQIRVHLQYIGHPVVGDPDYAVGKTPPYPISGQALHSARLTLQHPVTGEMLDLTAPLPQDMEDLIREIEHEAG